MWSFLETLTPSDTEMTFFSHIMLFLNHHGCITLNWFLIFKCTTIEMPSKAGWMYETNLHRSNNTALSVLLGTGKIWLDTTQPLCRKPFLATTEIITMDINTTTKKHIASLNIAVTLYYVPMISYSNIQWKILSLSHLTTVYLCRTIVQLIITLHKGLWLYTGKQLWNFASIVMWCDVHWPGVSRPPEAEGTYM